MRSASDAPARSSPRSQGLLTSLYLPAVTVEDWKVSTAGLGPSISRPAAPFRAGSRRRNRDFRGVACGLCRVEVGSHGNVGELRLQGDLAPSSRQRTSAHARPRSRIPGPRGMASESRHSLGRKQASFAARESFSNIPDIVEVPPPVQGARAHVDSEGLVGHVVCEDTVQL